VIVHGDPARAETPAGVGNNSLARLGEGLLLAGDIGVQFG